jgi:hypothetical protein
LDGTTRNASSRSWVGVAGDGAFISRSCACWFIGNIVIFAQVLCADEQHDDTVDAECATAMRRRAVLERAVEAAETLFHIVSRPGRPSRTP